MAAASQVVSKWKGVERLADGSIHRCLFCAIAGGKWPEQVLYDDGAVVAFTPRHPDAAVHVLVVPKGHVGNSTDLVHATEVPLVKHMHAVARHTIAVCRERLASGQAAVPSAQEGFPPLPTADAPHHAEQDPAVYCFHAAPWWNSIDHLHLHALDGAWVSGWKQWKHTCWPSAWRPQDAIAAMTAKSAAGAARHPGASMPKAIGPYFNHLIGEWFTLA